MSKSFISATPVTTAVSDLSLLQGDRYLNSFSRLQLEFRSSIFVGQ